MVIRTYDPMNASLKQVTMIHAPLDISMAIHKPLTTSIHIDDGINNDIHTPDLLGHNDDGGKTNTFGNS